MNAQGFRPHGNDIDLADWEEAALDRAWSRLFPPTRARPARQDGGDQQGQRTPPGEEGVTLDLGVWSEQRGPRGGHVWVNTSTGERHYRKDRPGSAEHREAHANRPAAHAPDAASAAPEREPITLPDVEGDDPQSHAEVYADTFNLLNEAGQDVTGDDIDAANEELNPAGWSVVWDRKTLSWAAKPLDEEDADEWDLSTYWLAGERAPKGGIVIASRPYRGGQWIPASVVEHASPEDKQKLAAAKAEADARKGAKDAERRKRPVDTDALHERLARHAGEPLAAHEQRSAASSYRMLRRHHGDLTLHRIEELAGRLERALAGIDDEHPNAEGLRGQIGRRLAQLHQLSAWHREGWTGRKGAPDKPVHGKVYNVPTTEMHVDPSRFQFKLNVQGPFGVGDEFRAVKVFNPDFAGVISVWKDPADGKTYVVNGHHRFELAARTGHPDLAVRYVKAATAREARAVGALINIAEGRGTAVDAAKFMRDMGVSPEDMEKHGVSLKGALARDAVTLTRLNDRLFDRVTRGTMDITKALAIAKHLHDPDLQDQLAKLLDKREDEGKDLSPKVIEEMAREMAETPKTTTTEATLFGDITSEESLFVPRNELKSHVRGEMSREVRDFLAVASKRRAGRVAGAGNVLNVDENKRIAEESERVLGVYDTLVNRKGAISDALNEAAADLAAAKTKRDRDAVKKRAVEAVRDAVFAEAGVGGDRPATPDAAGEGSAVPGGAGAPGGEPAAPAEAPAADAGRGGDQPDGLTPKPGSEHDIPALGKRSAFRAKFFPGRTPEELGVGWAGSESPSAYMPAESAKHFVNDLSGKVDVPPDSGNPTVDAVASGKGEILGKGDDGVVFGVGDKVAKVSTTVPFQPFNSWHRSPGQAADMLVAQADVNNRLADLGIPGVMRQEVVRHGDKAFAVRDRLEMPDRLTPEQLSKVRHTIDRIHDAGYVVGDDIQVGLKNGEPILYDLGKAQKSRHHDDYQDDSDRFERFAEKMGGEALPLKKHAEKALADSKDSSGFMPEDEEAAYESRLRRGLQASESAARQQSGASTQDAPQPQPEGVSDAVEEEGPPGQQQREAGEGQAAEGGQPQGQGPDEVAGAGSKPPEHATNKAERDVAHFNIMQHLSTARLDSDTEQRVLQHLGAESLSDAYRTLRTADASTLAGVQRIIGPRRGNGARVENPESWSLVKGVWQEQQSGAATPSTPDESTEAGRAAAREQRRQQRQQQLTPALGKIAVGEAGRVGGWFVRRTGADQYRVETDRGHRVLSAPEMADFLHSELEQQRPDQRRIDAARQRLANPDPAASAGRAGGLFGGEDLAGNEGVNRLPHGSRVLVRFGGDDSGESDRLGTVTKTADDAGREQTRVKLDNEPGEHVYHHSTVEPLDERHSWRVRQPERVPQQGERQGGLFDAPQPAPTESPKPKPPQVGQVMQYTGRIGTMPAEFRGFHNDPTTGEKMARVIVRPESGPPFETSVKPSELSEANSPEKSGQIASTSVDKAAVRSDNTSGGETQATGGGKMTRSTVGAAHPYYPSNIQQLDVEHPEPLENEAGKVTVKDGMVDIDLVVGDSLRKLGITRASPADAVTTVQGQEVLPINTNVGRRYLTLNGRPEVRSLLDNQKAISEAIASARSDYWAKIHAEHREPRLAEMRRQETEFAAKIPSDHVRVSANKIGNADGDEVRAYRVGDTRIPVELLTHHGTAQAMLPGDNASLEATPVYSVHKDELARLRGEESRKQADAQAKVDAHARKVAELTARARETGEPQELDTSVETDERPSEESSFSRVTRYVNPDGTISTRVQPLH